MAGRSTLPRPTILFATSQEVPADVPLHNLLHRSQTVAESINSAYFLTVVSSGDAVEQSRTRNRAGRSGPIPESQGIHAAKGPANQIQVTGSFRPFDKLCCAGCPAFACEGGVLDSCLTRYLPSPRTFETAAPRSNIPFEYPMNGRGYSIDIAPPLCYHTPRYSH